MKVLLLENRSVPIVTSMVWYGVGARHEKPRERGLAHLVEHMLFKGTRQLAKGEIDRLTASNGGFNNAFTSYDYTAYVFAFAADRWEVALEIEADRMMNTQFDPEEFDLEKRVVLEEIRMGLDSPWEAMRTAADVAAFGTHYFSRPVAGFYDEVKALRHSIAHDFYRRHYHPANAVLVVAGDFEPKEALRRMEDLLGVLDPASDPPAEFPGQVAKRDVGKMLTLDRPSPVARLLVALPSASFSTPPFWSLLLLEKILVHGKLSRLYRGLVEEGLASMVSSDLEETRDPYHFFLRCDVSSGVDPVDVRSRILQELEQLTSEPVSSEELARAKKQCQVQFLSDLETNFDRAFQVGLFESLGAGRDLESFPAMLDEVSRETILETARGFLLPASAVTVCLPEKAY